ncbi:DNA topoisomerase IB [Chitinophaga rhizosphaerae]|uniref:DNA topoisomerase IB n=1 Tax=Chitinophaga rhizosphaerae TaxID=1864947 RepID=UPI000F80F4E6|nr:DNA topoisomerase IB [Chitinophaga rhizosphaerae]
MEEKLLTADAPAVAQAARLRYVQPGMAGITRHRMRGGFYYTDAQGRRVTDKDVLARIRGLVLPPAWENVWICPFLNGHLQATGTDALGRRQYRYHARWAEVCNETKFYRLLAFGKQLPKLRRQVTKDLRRKTLDLPRVCAIAMRVMEETLMRVGNAEYESKYQSYGLTTLRNKHVRFNGQSALFRFKGKKGVEQQIELRHAALARLLRKVRDIPGQELFQYYENGEVKSLDSGALNDYLKSITGEDFTCKDFRTWAGTLEALHLLAACETGQSAADCKRKIVEVLDQVARKLGNTRAVCKKYYVHPALTDLYESGGLGKYLGQSVDEKLLLKILKDHHTQKRRRP